MIKIPKILLPWFNDHDDGKSEIKNAKNFTHFQTRIEEMEIKINRSTEHSRIIAELCNDGSNELASKIWNENKKF